MCNKVTKGILEVDSTIIVYDVLEGNTPDCQMSGHLEIASIGVWRPTDWPLTWDTCWQVLLLLPINECVVLLQLLVVL